MARREVRPTLNTHKTLPPGLTLDQIVDAVGFIESRVNTRDGVFYEVFMEQASALSAVVSVFANSGLDKVSPYKKDPNRFRSQDRFPDLRYGKNTLESKALKGFNTPNTHTPHGGWHIFWHYWCDPTRTITAGRVVSIVQVDVAKLKAGKWDRERDPNHLRGGDWNEGKRPKVPTPEGRMEDSESGHSHNYTLNRFGLEKMRDGTVYRLPTFSIESRGLVASTPPPRVGKGRSDS